MADNQFNESIRELLKGLDGFVTSKTVIGDPITVHETVIIPFMEVQMGVGAGAFTKKGQVDKLKGLRVKEDPEVTKKVEEILSPEEHAPSEA